LGSLMVVIAQTGSVFLVGEEDGGPHQDVIKVDLLHNKVFELWSLQKYLKFGNGCWEDPIASEEVLALVIDRAKNSKRIPIPDTR